MDLKKLAQLLGLPDTATEEDVEKALAALAEASKEANKGDEGKKEGRCGYSHYETFGRDGK